MKHDCPWRGRAGKLRSGREFCLYAHPEPLLTGKSFAAAIRQAVELDEAEVDSPINSPPGSPTLFPTLLQPSPFSSPLSSISSIQSTDAPRILSSVASSPGLRPDLGELSCDASDWVTEAEVDVDGDRAPFGPLESPSSSPPKFGKKRKRKAYPSDVAAKRERRRNKRCREKDAAGPTALRAPLYTGTPEVVPTELMSETHFPVNTTGYSADRVDSIHPDSLWTPQELEEMGFGVLSWDGRKPVTILDDERRVVAVLVGRPLKKSGNIDDWPEVVAGLEAAINKLEADSTFSAKQSSHRRGPHPAKAFGISHGGGQKKPSVLDQGSRQNCRAIRAFRKNKHVKCIAHFGSSAFSYYAPKLYARYCDYFGRLRQHDPSLAWSFPRSVFPATTVNFGPGAVCYDHLDYGNAAAGWCSITSAGSYNPKLGGHIVLFDIDKVVEFPPGSTILIPSSVMRHGNTPIQDGETRVGMTQYAAGALFRYVDHGFKLVDEADAEVRARVLAGAEARFHDLLELYSRFDELEQDRKVATNSITAPRMAPQRKRNADSALYNHEEILVESNTISLSRDGKRVRWDTEHVQSTLETPAGDANAQSGPSVEWPEYLPEDSLLPYDGEVPLADDSVEPPVPTIVNVQVEPRKRYVNSDIPLLSFIPLRQEYVDEYLRHAGRGTQDCYARCPGGCTEGVPVVRCKDCFDRWNGTFFEKTDLRALGLRLQLGHPSGQCCPYQIASSESFTVLHTNGIHQLAVDFCNCLPTVEHRVQCMRQSWWPASTERPRSAATFAVLQQFQTLSLQGKLAMYDYYKSLELVTDGSSLEKIPFRLSQLSLMVREYRHVKMLVQAGRGHNPAGIVTTKPGEIAVHCRACPQPGINLPEGWENDVENRRSSDSKDPTLGPGWATFVDDGPYHEHLKNYIHKDEASPIKRRRQHGLTAHRTDQQLRRLCRNLPRELEAHHRGSHDRRRWSSLFAA
ncbi:hypothetical protein HWV62_29298 [Athelia sp. TMB]|nr:hypothetical protein HWV62_29298 [Athelia sp. TMB]